MDRHTLATIQRAVKHKVGRPIQMNGERILYCFRCLRSNYEVTHMAWEPFFVICDECSDNLATFFGHLREQKQRHTQAQFEPDEGESAQGREGELP